MNAESEDLVAPAELAALLSGDESALPLLDGKFADAKPYELPPFEDPDATLAANGSPAGDDHQDDHQIEIRIELGRAELPTQDALELRAGAVVSLDKLATDPVDILANGRLIARGEILVLNDRLCVRVAEIFAAGSSG